MNGRRIGVLVLTSIASCISGAVVTAPGAVAGQPRSVIRIRIRLELGVEETELPLHYPLGVA